MATTAESDTTNRQSSIVNLQFGSGFTGLEVNHNIFCHGFRIMTTPTHVTLFIPCLVDILQVTDLCAEFNGQITYHDSCHLRYGLKISEQPRRLIENVHGCRLVEMDESDRCCGFGGSFAVKYPEISTAMLEDKINSIIASGAGTVVGGDIGCLMNISGILSRRRQPIEVLHIAQLLAGKKEGGNG